VRSYSANEYAFIAQIYEPPLQYHFLKRPYTLVPLTAEAVPEPTYLDADGNPLPADADPDASRSASIWSAFSPASATSRIRPLPRTPTAATSTTDLVAARDRA
jgi:hypothetical protein